MKKLLVIVDMQNDFIDGSLGSKEAKMIVPNVLNKIQNWDGDIVCTYDTHQKKYLDTNEGKHLPVEHCIAYTNGWFYNEYIVDAVETYYTNTNKTVLKKEKNTFGSIELAQYVLNSEYDYVELVGLCTDICVVSNALLVKAYTPEIDIAVDASCCAGVTPESHKAALMTMKMCQIDILNKGE